MTPLRRRADARKCPDPIAEAGTEGVRQFRTMSRPTNYSDSVDRSAEAVKRLPSQKARHSPKIASAAEAGSGVATAPVMMPVTLGSELVSVVRLPVGQVQCSNFTVIIIERVNNSIDVDRRTDAKLRRTDWCRQAGRRIDFIKH